MKLGPSVILIWHLESLPSEAWSVGTSGTSAQFWFGDNIQINPQPFLPRGKVAWVRTKTSWITPPTMVSVGLRRKVTYIIAQLYIFFQKQSNEQDNLRGANVSIHFFRAISAKFQEQLRLKSSTPSSPKISILWMQREVAHLGKRIKFVHQPCPLSHL